MAKKSGWNNGVKKLSAGKYLLRVTWTDAAGKRHDTERVARIDTMAEALTERARLQEELSGPGEHGWTVAYTLDRYVPTQRPGTRHSWSSYARRIIAVFGERRLGTITPAEVQRFLYQLPVSDSTANVIRTLFGRAFVYARDCGEYAGANPVKETSTRRTPKTNEQLLDEQDNPPRRAYLGDEAQRFLAALDPDLRPLQAVQLFLGCRFGEVSAMEWRDVNFDTGEVRLRQGQYKGALGVTKGKRQRRTGLGPHALEMLRAHRERMASLRWPGWERLVFPRPPCEHGQERRHDMWNYPTVRVKVVEAQRIAGIDVVARTHAMRHTHVTAAEVQRELAMDAAMFAADTSALHRSMVGHASETQSRTYIEPRALPVVRLATELERALVGENVRDSATTSRND